MSTMLFLCCILFALLGVSRCISILSAGPYYDAIGNRAFIEIRHLDDLGRGNAKYYSDSPFTYFRTDMKPNACGSIDSDGDFVVALNAAQFDGGSHCYDMVVISYAGKTVQAKVTDRCERCGEHGLDFSESLFAYFAPTSDGLLWGDWEFWGVPTSSTHVTRPSSTSSSVTSADQHAPSTSLTLTFPHSMPATTSEITPTFPTSPLSTTNANSYPPRPSSHFSTSSTSSSSPSFPTLRSHTTNPPTLIPPASISSSAILLSTTSSSLLTKSSSITASVTLPPNTTSPLPSVTGQTGSQVAHPTANRGIMFRPTLGMLSFGMCGVLAAAGELL